MKKVLAIAGAGVAAVALGGGLFAWQANMVIANNGIVAGSGQTAQGCTASTLFVEQNDPVWSGTAWTVNGGTVTFDPQDTACNTQNMTLAAVAGNGSVIQSGAAQLTITNTEVSANEIQVPITLGSPADLSQTVQWTVTIVP